MNFRGSVHSRGKGEKKGYVWGVGGLGSYQTKNQTFGRHNSCPTTKTNKLNYLVFAVLTEDGAIKRRDLVKYRNKLEVN